MLALPGSKVLVFGPKWDKKYLTPWVYDLKEDTWSNKLEPDGKPLPSLPKELSGSMAIHSKQKVYAFLEEFVYILDLSTLDDWE